MQPCTLCFVFGNFDSIPFFPYLHPFGVGILPVWILPVRSVGPILATLATSIYSASPRVHWVRRRQIPGSLPQGELDEEERVTIALPPHEGEPGHSGIGASIPISPRLSERNFGSDEGGEDVLFPLASRPSSPPSTGTRARSFTRVGSALGLQIVLYFSFIILVPPAFAPIFFLPRPSIVSPNRTVRYVISIRSVPSILPQGAPSNFLFGDPTIWKWEPFTLKWVPGNFFAKNPY